MIYVPFFHQRKTRQYEQCLFSAPQFLCHPRQQSEKAKGHRFLEEMLAWPLLLPRENGLLVLRLRMNWTVGGKGTLSPALAERIMEALENNAFASSWTLLRAVPPHSLSVAGTIGLESQVPAGRASGLTPSVGWDWCGALWGAGLAALLALPTLEASVSVPRGGAGEEPWRPSSPLIFNWETLSPGNIWSSQLGEGC